MSEELTTPLSAEEKKRFEEQKRIIRNGQYEFLQTLKSLADMEVFGALRVIEQEHLYRGYGSMADFVQTEFPVMFGVLSKRRVYQMIGAAKVVQNLEQGGVAKDALPTNEKQVRSLTALPAEQQVQVWQDATMGGVVPTGNSVAATVQKILGSTGDPIFTETKAERFVKNEEGRQSAPKKGRAKPVQGSLSISYQAHTLDFLVHQPAFGPNMRAKNIPVSIPLDDLVALGFHVPIEEEHEV